MEPRTLRRSKKRVDERDMRAMVGSRLLRIFQKRLASELTKGETKAATNRMETGGGKIRNITAAELGIREHKFQLSAEIGSTNQARAESLEPGAWGGVNSTPMVFELVRPAEEKRGRRKGSLKQKTKRKTSRRTRNWK